MKSPVNRICLSRWVVFGGLLLLLIGVGVFLLRKSRSDLGGNHREPPVQLPGGAAAPIGADGKRQWSDAVVHYPGYPLYENDREWSHREIAGRHKALLMKDLPDYVLELRGGGRLNETPDTTAGWYFVVPREHMQDFRQYLLELGVPEEALQKRKIGPIPPEYQLDDDERSHRVIPAAPATKLVFIASSGIYEGEAALQGMQFGKSSETAHYTFINPNILRAEARITVGWKTGNVQVCEVPTHPEWER